VDFVNEKNVTGFEAGEQAGEVAGLSMTGPEVALTLTPMAAPRM